MASGHEGVQLQVHGCITIINFSFFGLLVYHAVSVCYSNSIPGV